MSQAGKWMVLFGTVIALAGLIIWLAGDKLNWLGRLPGDIRIERENFRFYFPITTLILINVVLWLLIWVGRRLF